MDHLPPITQGNALKHSRWTRLDGDGYPRLHTDPRQVADEGTLSPDEEGLTYLALRDHGLCHARAARTTNVWRLNLFTPKDVVQILEDWDTEKDNWHHRIDGSMVLGPITTSESDRFLTCAAVWRKDCDESGQETICQQRCCDTARQALPALLGETRWRATI